MNVLATCDGHRPLTDDIVVTVAVAFGWATDIAVTDEQVRDLARRLVDAWESADEGTMSMTSQAFSDALRCRAALLMHPQDAHSLKQACQHGYLRIAQHATGSALADWIVTVGASSAPPTSVLGLQLAALAKHRAAMRIVAAMDGGAVPRSDAQPPMPDAPAPNGWPAPVASSLPPARLSPAPAPPTELARVPGAPPLTEDMLTTIAALYGWANQIAISNELVADLARRLTEAWLTGDARTINDAIDALHVAQQRDHVLDAHPEAETGQRGQCQAWFWELQMRLGPESALCDWMYTVGQERTATSTSSHDTYIDNANASLSAHVSAMQSLRNW